MRYTCFEWDDAKNLANIRKHGFSFASATLLFERPHLVSLDTRKDYGEDRWVAIGWIGTVLGVVVHTVALGQQGNITVRIISARKASSREIEKYERKIQN